jgi:hypothetical protein
MRDSKLPLSVNEILPKNLYYVKAYLARISG